MTSLAEARPVDGAGIWITLRQSSLPVRAMLIGVLVDQLGGFLQTFLVLFLTHRGFSDIQAAVALGGLGSRSRCNTLI